MGRSVSKGLSILLLVLGVAACAGPKEADKGASSGEGARSRAQASAEPDLDLVLAPTSDQVRTIQLYHGNDERQPPVAQLNGRTPLTLEFDLMEPSGRPLSVYFYHADRSWRRDLHPGEYLTSFQRDDLLDFTPSRAADSRYTHYTYRFPNNNIDFEISGNFVLRVTELGDEQTVLFERPFFVAEQQTPVEMQTDNVMVGGSSFPATVPIVRFDPSTTTGGNAYDYDVCFVRNGRFELQRCTDRVMLAGQPVLQFYLEPDMAFTPDIADYYLDLTSIRVGGRIEGTDLTTVPYRVTLEPDYARFPGTAFAEQLNGQTVVSTAERSVAEPDLSAEYVEVGFSFVPPNEAPVQGEIVLTGSFNGWQYDPANRLEWVGERGRYEGSLLLKQGEYEYRYLTTDRQLRRYMNNAPPRNDNLYMAFVYYTDLHISTDRLLAVSAIRGQ